MADNELNPSEEVQNTENASETETGEETAQQLSLDINVEERSACERHITVSIAREDVDRFMQKEFDEMAPTAQVPGFRPGHAPRKLLENRYRKEVAERVKNALIVESLSQVNESEKLAPISDPDFEYGAIEVPEEGNFVYEYDLEVRPEFEIPEWRGMKLERPVREFSDADVEEASVAFRSRFGKLEESDQPATSGDFINTKLMIRYNDEVINSSEAETIRLRPQLLFSDATLENFDAQMEGVSANETRTLKLTLSNEAPNVLLRGKEVDAVFEVKSVLKSNIPAADDEFISRFSFKTLDQYNEFLRNQLKRQMEYQQEQTARENITSLLLESASWELPPKMLEEQAERELYRSMIELQRNGFSLEQIQEHLNYLRQNSREQTAKLLKEHFILEAIAESENIDAEEADYDAEIQEIALQTGDTARKVRARLEKQNRMDVLRNQIVERKVVNLIIENAQFEETTFEPYPAEMATVEFPAGGESKGDVEEQDVAEEAPASDEANA